MSENVRQLELLAPARDAETAIAAIDCGADAIYMGGPHHGARAAAGNAVTDIRRVCEYAHRFRVSVYVTLNTLIYDDETEAVVDTVRELYRAGVDALIVQDMSLLRLSIPPIALHASTQTDCRTPEKARFMQDMGMSCVVIPREASLDEIRAFRAATDVTLEAFVHGALCVSYSGDCRASLVNGGRSANRGECAQICRLRYNLTDADNKVIVPGQCLLSLKDLNRLTRLREMADAGIGSFKIEGRLKSKEYVMNVTAAYSSALDEICAASGGRYRRASAGHSCPGFTPDLSKSFNRGYTVYALDGTDSLRHTHIASPLTPKWTGERLGRVGRVYSPRKFEVRPENGKTLHNGDGLVFREKNGEFRGFRVNRTEGITVSTAEDVRLRPGDVLTRNFDKIFTDSLLSAKPDRRIRVSMNLTVRYEDTKMAIALTVADSDRGCRVTAVAESELQKARTSQEGARRRVLDKLGDTIYTLDNLVDEAGDAFIPASVLTALRRRAIADLDHAAAATYPVVLRGKEKKDVTFPGNKHLTFHDNVANGIASDFYSEHGAETEEKALELESPKALAAREVRVMTSRHCIRRELGMCLREHPDYKGPLFLECVEKPLRKMRLDFDCSNCLMHVTALP